MNTMKSTQIARRYAEALFSAISPTDRTNLAEEFRQVLKVFEDQVIADVFNHPRTTLARKSELIRLMKLSKTLENFLLLTVEKSRDQFLPQIESHFQRLVLEAEHTALAEVTSAIPLKTETLERLKDQLQKLVHKTVLLSTKVDSKIGGGLIIKVDGKVIDGSVSHSLKRFQRALTS